ncbi:MAG: hypothetical protein ACLFWL_15990 [Candidatus Brocadiia bacterium]
MGKQDTYHNHAHKREGVNGVFYDGSARWISLEEVKADGVQVCSPSGPLDAEFFLNNDTWGAECRDNLQMWAKKCATLRPD